MLGVYARHFSTKVAKRLHQKYDVAIIGAGIVGTATARELLMRSPHLKVAVLDKESQLGAHQSSHNSGVIHCGIYYTPGSAKARLCVKGLDLMYEYCETNNLPVDRCGKVIVAVRSEELPLLDRLYQRGLANGIKGLRMIDPVELKKIEPEITGIAAIHSPNTGIVDYHAVTMSFGRDIQRMGGDIHLNFEANNFVHHPENNTITITSAAGESLNARYIITCAGLYSDRVSKLAFGGDEPTIVPFRGHFLKFKDQHKGLIKGMVYPVPNPAFPFLGVHFTKKINGEVWLGPNAVLATDRQGYSYTDMNLRDMWESLLHPGLRKLVMKHWKYGTMEFIRDVFPWAFLQLLKPYMPQITMDQVVSGGSGVRAMAISTNGSLVEDFVFDTPSNGAPVLHCRNLPPPAATSSLAIAIEIIDQAQKSKDFPNGVIHSGIYYTPGSTKARLCVKGVDLMYEYCAANNVPVDVCGKVIVALRPDELPSLERLYQRGITNGVKGLRMIDPVELKKIEPAITGIAAIHLPNTGIVDFHSVTESFGRDIQRMGGDIHLNFEANNFVHHPENNTITVTSAAGESLNARYIITCAVPFRGHFLKLKDQHKGLIKGMVYPVPNPAFPFLGVHFTKKINGDIWLGPNAVLATDREGYSYTDFNLRDMWESLLNPGLRKLSLKHWKYGVGEFIRDVFPSAFLQHLTPYMPQITIDHVEQGNSGVRAMAMSPEGTLIEDFVFDTPSNGAPVLHCRNSPSPAATSSLAIAIEIVDQAQKSKDFPKVI
eukprot:gene7504-8780_t